MGLLDIFDSEQGRLGLGLLAMAGPQARPMGFGERLMGAYGMVDAMRQQKRAQELDDIKKDLYRAQIGETNAQAEERRALVADKQRTQALLQAMPSFFRQSATQGSVSTPEIGGVPMFSAGSKVDQPSMVGPMQFDAIGAARFGAPPEIIEKYAKLTDVGRPEVARTIEVDDGKGGKATRQFDKFGNRVGDDLPAYIAPVQVNQGDRVTFTRPQAGVSLPMNMSPSERDASARGWASNSLAQQRFNWEQNKDAKPSFNADAGGFIVPPSATNPNGSIIPLKGFQQPMTDAQAKALLFGSRMEEANQILGDMQAKGVSRSGDFKRAVEDVPLLGRALTPLGNAMQSDDQQKVDQAKRNFLTAVLRRESGAVISPEEFRSGDQQYFPQMGDSDETIKQKAKNRQTAIQGIMAEVPQGRVPQVFNNANRRQPGSVGSGTWGIERVN